MKKRSQEDDHQMLYLAHASRYHWGLIGTPRNRAVGEWQISRVYADLGQPKLALRFARASLATCKKNDIVDIVHTANEAVARAYAVAKNYDKAREYLDRACRQLQKLSLNREDRRIYSEQIQETERLIEN
jgi:tetratricopeptide (TPR) repeat protein